MRCFHLLCQLAYHHEVHAIIFQKEEELRKNTEGYKVPDNVKIYSPIDNLPPPSLFNKLPQRIGPGLHFRWLRRNWRGPAEETLLRCHHLVDRILAKINVDVTVFEELGSMSAAPLVQRLQPSSYRIVNMYNVNHKLRAQEIKLSKNSGVDLYRQKKSLKNTEWLEQNLNKFVHSFFACSDEDRKYLESLNEIKGFKIPNGVDTQYFSFDANTEKFKSPYVLYTGWMGTKANQDGLSYLLEDIWPKLVKTLPSLKLLIVGGGMPPQLATKFDKVTNIEIVGNVPDVRPYSRKASVSLVPLRIGSGTRLKILESMSQGVPVVSTAKGAEGIETENGKHILIAETPTDFAQSIKRLLSDNLLYNQIRLSARKMVEEKYAWDIIGQNMNKAIHELLETQELPNTDIR
ncbi:glycosyltransferase [Thermodesulfobacteriota bacterium]